MLFRPLFALVLPLALSAQAPVITFEKTHYDFGRITPDRKVAAKYKVTNTGNAILSITQVRPSCGCTATVMGKWSIAPGETTDLEATFDPKGLKGGVRKSIEVISNDPKTPASHLTLEAEVIQEIMPSVESVYFSQVPKNATSRSTVRYASGNGQAVEMLDVKAPGAPYLTFAFRQEGKDVSLEVAFDGRKVPAGQFRGVEQATVRFKSATLGQLPLNIQWELKPAVQATPVALVFEGAPGAELRQTLTLKQGEGRAFQVTAFRGSLKGVRVEGLNRKGAQVELAVILPSGLKAGRYSELLTLTTDDPDQPELTLRLAAILK